MAHVLAKDLRESVFKYALEGKLTSSDKTINLISIDDNLFSNFFIPENWGLATVKESCYIHARIGWQALSKREHLADGEYMLITGTDFKNGLVNYSTCVYVSKERYEMDKKIQLQNDDILITKDGTLGKVAVVKNLPKPATLNGGVFVVRPDSRFNKDYIELIFNSSYFSGFINNIKKSTTIKHLNQKKLHEFLIPVPPIEEQARIVAKVDEIMAKIDEYEKLENQLVKLKEQFPQDMKDSLLQAGMMGKLTEQLESDTIVDETSSFNTLNEQRFDIPKGWTWFNLKDLMSICTGKKDQNFATRDGAYNFYTCAKEVFKAPNYSFEGESLILPGNGANVGTVTLYNGKFEAYQRTYVLQSINKTINMKFMYYCLLENWNRYNKNKMFGSAIPYIKLGNLQNYPVALPPIEEQQRIVDKLDELLPLVDKLAELN